MRLNPRLSLLSLGLAAAGLLASCGGSDSAPVTNVSGAVVKGPVSGATVCAYKATASGKGDQLKCATSGAAGTYAMDIEYAGDVVIEASGGTYTDEATNTTKTLAEPMQVVINSQGGAATGVVTPLTSVAYSVSKGMPGGITNGNFTTAGTTVASQFQLGTVNIATTLPAVTGATNAYGNVLRAVSQFIANGNTQASFQAFASPAALQAAFSTAYATINGSTVTFSFGGTGSTGGTGTGGTGTGGTGTGGTGTGGSSAQSCGITVSGSGTVVAAGMTVPFTLPATKVCVTNVPANACNAESATLKNLAAGGATPTGNYTLTYNYSYAPGDCAGAIATVNYTQ